METANKMIENLVDGVFEYVEDETPTLCNSVIERVGRFLDQCPYEHEFVSPAVYHTYIRFCVLSLVKDRVTQKPLLNPDLVDHLKALSDDEAEEGLSRLAQAVSHG